MRSDHLRLLSLKNIYRLLTKDDYPLPSSAPVPAAARRGQTLLGFWRQMLAPDLAVGQEGLKLWGDGDQRNRYLSDLFNRSRPLDFYKDYFDAVSDQLDANRLLAIIGRMQRFWLAGRGDHDILVRRVEQLLANAAEADEDVSISIHEYFHSLLQAEAQFSSQAERRSFFDAYLLSMLALHAFFGMKMNNGALGRLRRGAAAQPLQLYSVYQHRNRGTGFPPPQVLTRQFSQLCRPPMEKSNFFGRDSLLEQLSDRIRQGAKLLVTGVGGIGKTELLRQALHTLLREGVFTRVAYVQYERSLQESMLAAFLDLHSEEPAQQLEECIARLEVNAPERSLLLIDNMDLGPEEDSGLDRLAVLGCDVVITSRVAGLPGFVTFPVGDLDLPAARQLFCAHLGRPLGDHEEEPLNRLLQERLRCHTLLCGMMGDMAHARHLEVHDLLDMLEREGLGESFVLQGQRVNVQAVLLQMFRALGLSPREHKILQTLALLPYTTYSYAHLKTLLQDSVDTADALSDELAILEFYGWLEPQEGGYAMHPAIARALQAEGIAMEGFPRLWDMLAGYLQQIGMPAQERAAAWLAGHALQRCFWPTDSVLQVPFQVALDASIALVEAMRASLAGALLDHLAPYAERGQLSSSLLYDYHAARMLLYIRYESGENPETHIREIARLFQLAPQSRHRLIGVEVVLAYAAHHVMTDTLRGLMEQVTAAAWEGVDYVKYCYTMARYETLIDRNYQRGKGWAQKGIAALDNLGRSLPEMSLALHFVLAELSAHTGELQAAEEAVNKATRLHLAAYGDDQSIQLAVIYGVLGLTYYQGGAFEKALEHLQAGAKITGAVAGGRSTQHEVMLSHIGIVYFRMGDFAQAAEQHRQALSLDAARGIHNSPQRSGHLNNLGCALRDGGQLTQALPLLQEAAEMAQTLGGVEWLPWAEPQFNLGLLYLKMGQPDKAATHLKLAIPIFETSYGDQHPRTNRAREALASAVSAADGAVRPQADEKARAEQKQ